MDKQDSVGKLPEGQVAPGLHLIKGGFPKDSANEPHQISHSVCLKLPTKSLPALGICMPSRFSS